ncbi:hypothetical protein H0H93_008845 [Arthromyces matolae]|nr:hypothetical protein H0H93_008845 [Arthromyces matolae]
MGVVNPPSVEVIQDKAVYRIFGQFTQPHTKDLGAKYYSHLFDLLQRGDIKPNRIEVVHGGLGAVADGLKRLELDQVSGVKLIVHPQETA